MLKLITLLSFTTILVGCENKYNESRPFDYLPDMRYTVSRKAQAVDAESNTGTSDRMPPDGTVARDAEIYPYKKEETERAGKELKNPLPRTKVVLERGQKIYNSYCIVCHGPGGSGDGFVVPKFPRPPSLLSDKIRNLPDGGIYHIVTMGQNGMFSYASQIASSDRWAVAHYVRVLQRANRPDGTGVQGEYIKKVR